MPEKSLQRAFVNSKEGLPLQTSRKGASATQMKKKRVQPRTLKFDIKFRVNNTNYEIGFTYNLQEDNPEKIANEMKTMLQLPEEKINAIRHQIEKLVSQS